MNRVSLHILLLIALVTIMAANNAHGQTIEIINATCFDAVTGEFVYFPKLTIKEGKIASFGLIPRFSGSADAEQIDGRGKFILPGFIDTHCHFHLLFDDPGKPGFQQTLFDEKLSRQMLQKMLAWGITTVRNPAAPCPTALEFIRKLKAEEEGIWPHMLSAGNAIQYGQKKSSNTDEVFFRITDSADLKDEIARQAKAGVAAIKVYWTMPPEFVRLAVTVAAKHRLPVIAHAGRCSWAEAAEAGVATLCHLSDWHSASLPEAARPAYQKKFNQHATKARIVWMELVDFQSSAFTDMVVRLARKPVVVESTLISQVAKFRGVDADLINDLAKSDQPEKLMEFWRIAGKRDDWSESELNRAKQVWPKILQMIGRYARNGVRMSVGTDFPNPYVGAGIGYHHELELLVAAGISEKQVLQMATLGGAQALNLSDRGQIRFGYTADLVIITENPLENIANTRRLYCIIREGRIIYPQ